MKGVKVGEETPSWDTIMKENRALPSNSLTGIPSITGELDFYHRRLLPWLNRGPLLYHSTSQSKQGWRLEGTGLPLEVLLLENMIQKPIVNLLTVEQSCIVIDF